MTTPRADARPTGTTYIAVLDPLDLRAVLNLVRNGPLGGVEEFKPYVGWRSNWALADDLDGLYPPPTAELSEAEALDIIERIRPPHPDRPPPPRKPSRLSKTPSSSRRDGTAPGPSSSTTSTASGSTSERTCRSN